MKFKTMLRIRSVEAEEKVLNQYYELVFYPVMCAKTWRILDLSCWSFLRCSQLPSIEWYWRWLKDAQKFFMKFPLPCSRIKWGCGFWNKEKRYLKSIQMICMILMLHSNKITVLCVQWAKQSHTKVLSTRSMVKIKRYLYYLTVYVSILRHMKEAVCRTLNFLKRMLNLIKRLWIRMKELAMWLTLKKINMRSRGKCWWKKVIKGLVSM